MNTAQLDQILSANTAISSFAELMATDATYVPTLDLRACPALYEVAVALVANGRDAYLCTKTGARVFAKDIAYKAPEVLAAEFGIVVPKLAPRRLRGTVFKRGNDLYKADRTFKDWLGSGVKARRWNKTHKRWNKTPSGLRITEVFVFENAVR